MNYNACRSGGCRLPFCQVLILQSPIRRCHHHTGLTDCCGEPWEGWGCLQPIRHCMVRRHGGRLRLLYSEKHVKRHKVKSNKGFLIRSFYYFIHLHGKATAITEQLTSIFYSATCIWSCKIRHLRTVLLCILNASLLSYICTNKCLLEADCTHVRQKHLFSAVRCQICLRCSCEWPLCQKQSHMTTNQPPPSFK